MASLTFPVLVLAAVCIFHTETGDAKAVVQHREKRAPGQYSPRLGRRSKETVPDADQIKELLSLDPRLKKEYIEVFLKLLKEKLGDNKQLAENFLAYPRLGRAMNFFHWPRSGKRGDAEMCCDGLIAYMNDDDIFNTVCNAPQCCDGYEEKIKRPHNSKNIFFVCVRSEYDESQGKLEA
ncbi:uncharacterized protein LOC143057736 isoform X2 [Mytilus galloprovincialis]|uniref:uncharacterized protein LOC143057736 isoform X2 n=1 Tax=Mytilus galloprovincialis TaxID=29158 RepID=UPI003F7BCE25